MSRCQVCCNHCREVNSLDCGHLLCNSCVDANTSICGSKVVKCPWIHRRKQRPCGDETSLGHVEKVFMSKSPLQTGSVSVDDEIEDLTAYDPREKAMDKDLRKLADKLGRNPSKKKQQQRTASCSGGEGEEEEPPEKRPRASGSAADLEELERQKAAALEEEKYIAIYLQLSSIVKNCKDIQGFYESDDCDKFIIDITTGKEDSVTKFLKASKIGDDVTSKYFEFVEQDGPMKFLVATGAKITLADPYQALIQNHPDTLTDRAHVGTVTCLGQDARGDIYILTAKHLFGSAADTELHQNFISAYRSRLQLVSDSCYGYIGGATVQTSVEEQLIDIAAIKLQGHIQDSLRRDCPQLVKDLNPMYNKTGMANRKDLKGRVVYKHGAVTGTTCGIITKPNYYANSVISGNGPLDVSGTCFIVESVDPKQNFAEEGDSGALIWDDSGTPIGLVSFERQGYRIGKQVAKATFCVRLDYSLRALLSKTNIEIVKCLALGSPIPVDSRPDTRIIQPMVVA